MSMTLDSLEKLYVRELEDLYCKCAGMERLLEEGARAYAEKLGDYTSRQ